MSGKQVTQGNLPYIPPTEVAKAKKIDLLTYMQNYAPEDLQRHGNTAYKLRSVPGLKLSHGLWCWWDGNMQGGKSAVDFFVKVHGYSFQEAVQKVLGNVHIRDPTPCTAPLKTAVEFQKPAPAPDNADVIHYLTNRGIDRHLIDYCIDTGMLYQSTQNIPGYSKTFKVAVFPGYNSDGDMRYAMTRQTNGKMKGEVSGSNKRYAFGLPAADPECQTAHFFEAPIDALSFETLNMMEGKNLLQRYLQSTGGIYASVKHIHETTVPMAMEMFFQTHPLVKHAHIHFDNDEKGTLAAQAMSVILPKRFGVKVYVEPPPKGKDYNDCLCMCLNRRQQCKNHIR